MNIVANFEHRASSSRGKHEGESSFALCDRLGRTRDNSQRQLPTDHDYAVPTREYQTDQSSIKTAPAAARSVLEKTQRQLQKHPHRFLSIDTVTPYQCNSLSERLRSFLAGPGKTSATRREDKQIAVPTGCILTGVGSDFEARRRGKTDGRLYWRGSECRVRLGIT